MQRCTEADLFWAMSDLSANSFLSPWAALRRALRATFLDSRAEHAVPPIQWRGACRAERLIGAQTRASPTVTGDTETTAFFAFS